jgi:hypothetical protein
MADTEVSVTFVDEGARHRSVLGYFAHGDAGTALGAVNILDNASTVGSGNALIPGDTTGLWTFPAGTSLGFHSTADGYRSGRAVPDDLIDGTATLPSPLSIAPEPVTLILALTAIPFLIVRRPRRRRPTRGGLW